MSELPNIDLYGPLPQPSNDEKEYLFDLISTFREFPTFEIANVLPSEALWLNHMNRLKELVLSQDPRMFLRWDVIAYTMFVGNVGYIAKELNYLKSRPDWNTRWRNAINESFAGYPVPYIHYPSSSGNLIHHAYHLSQFEDKTKVRIQDMDFILEFGGGYGSMCRLCQNLGFNGRYLIFDLPQFSALQTYYLKTLNFSLISPDEFINSSTGITCISDNDSLKDIIKNQTQTVNKMFIATWSISETPINIRNTILPLISDFKSFLVAFQDEFGEVNNLDFFSKWKETMDGIEWYSWRINHISGNNYLVGTQNLTHPDVDQLLKKGEDLFASGDMSEAEEHFKKILDLSPRNLDALNDLGVIAFMRSDFKQAINYFIKALEIDEFYIKAIENYPKCLIAVDEHLNALNFIRESFKKGVINTELLNMMGNCFIELNDLKSALTTFKQSLSMNNEQQEIIILIGKIENILKTDEHIDDTCASKSRMNIGFISIWFERGQSYVTKILRDCILDHHNTFIFARTGGVYGQAKLETSGFWDIPNLTTYPEYNIPSEEIKKWINDNNLQAVIFNEEYDWALVQAAKETGIKVLTYLDYYKDEWRKHMGLYDAVLCSTQRTYNLVKELCKAYYMGWGVDTDLFSPNEQKPEYTFFHNAGWLGINFRKMTPAAIAAFDAVSRVMPEVNMLVHSQVNLDLFPPVISEIIHRNERIVFHEETLPAPGLYHKGKIMLFPTKLEGLGLPLFEALSCGLPVIAANAPPMNEFIKDGYNGSLVNVAFRATRDDNVAFPEEIIDMTDLAVKMAKLANDDNLRSNLAINARQYALEKLSLPFLSERVLNILNRIK